MSKLSEERRKTEYEAIREYIGRATSGLGGIKNLTWRFLVANTVIASFIIWHKAEIGSGKCIIIISFGCLCFISVVIACHSFIKLKERRIELRELYNMFEFLVIVRPDYRVVVGSYDIGDWLFFISGITLPVFLLNIVYKIFYNEYFFELSIYYIMLVMLVYIFLVAWISYRLAKCVEKEREELLLNPEKAGEISAMWWKRTCSCLCRGRFARSVSE